ncbi:ABC transporter permease [uncultured Arthrobacter sp.]|uniref:ABC transporter permease n=1 Tax=uncultured Arthrobacter sp. TaxID=114050 RepID=UPI0025ED53C2|nr:ABC transporter permease [uncultured Arthrobacter sp.]
MTAENVTAADPDTTVRAPVPSERRGPSSSAPRMLWGLVVLVAVSALALTTDGFVSVANARAILSSVSFTGILAVGTVVIMLSGNLFSLSIGTSAAVSSMLFLYLLPDVGFVLAVLLTLVAGYATFALQGAIVGRLDGNAIIVTIGAGALQVGAVTWLLPGSVQVPDGVDIGFLTRSVLGLPFPLYVFLAVALLVQCWLHYSATGRQVELVGENKAAARAAGLPTGKLVTVAFAVAGLCTAITGILLAGFNQNANLAVSGTFTFDAIAAAIVGGSSVIGGRGSAARAVLGAVIIATIANMLLLRGFGTGVRVLVEGIVVVLVVVAAQRRKRSIA